MDPKAVPVAQSPRKIPATLRGKLEKNSTGWKQMRSLPKSINPQNGYIIQLLWKKTMENSECVWTLESSTSIWRENTSNYPPGNKLLASRLAGAIYFSKLDANQLGYWLITLDEESSRLTTFNTPFGRYRFRRMPFGIHSAQEVFQKRISQHFEDLEGVETDIDDILVWGTTMRDMIADCALRWSERSTSVWPWIVKNACFAWPRWRIWVTN